MTEKCGGGHALGPHGNVGLGHAIRATTWVLSGEQPAYPAAASTNIGTLRCPCMEAKRSSALGPTLGTNDVNIGCPPPPPR